VSPASGHGPAIRLATRSSPQARTQAQGVADALVAATGRAAELVFVDTTGDRRQDVPLHVIGGQGVFVKEVQQAVLDGRADVAVHSAKDLPSVAHEALVLGALLARRDPADALIGRSLDELADGATVASGSVRRRAQLAAVRPDLTFVELRGNIATRLSKVPDGGAIVMAVAALQVLGSTDLIAERLDPALFVPAVGQGCVAVEARADDAATLALLAAVDDAATRHDVEVERSFLAELGSGCSLPVGAHVAGRSLLTFLAADDGGRIARGDVALAFDRTDHDAARAAARAARAEVDG
jgi:hydroxymethylbilane synthase